jgi:mono/diheme cytochrome c family protein
MPSFRWQLNDEQVAAVLTYIRNAWQTPAAAVSAEAVGKARDGLRTRAD